MYNDEKKLITDIQRKKDLEANLARLADKVYISDFEYACHKFTLNYFTVQEMLADKDIADDPYIYECILAINKLTEKYVILDAVDCEDADIALINEMRNKVTSKMKVLTSYTDYMNIYLTEKNSILLRMKILNLKKNLLSLMLRNLLMKYSISYSVIMIRLPLMQRFSK